MIEDQKPRLIIQEWAISRKKDCSNPDKFVYVLVGRCPQSPKIIATEPLVYFNFEKRLAEGSGKVYDLGSIEDFWVESLEDRGILFSSFDFDERKGA